ncbi:MAG: hypothetical protein ACKOTZ_03525, partial [Chloroflexota bacterium]
MRRIVALVAVMASLALVVLVLPSVQAPTQDVGHEGQGGATVVHACVSAEGRVTIVGADPAIACPSGWDPLHWAKQGPKGDTGERGARGVAG